MPATTTEAPPACADAPDPDAFLHVKGEHRTTGPPDRARELARDYCAHCPIRLQCSEDGDRTEELGLWGGQWRTKRSGGTYTKTTLI